MNRALTNTALAIAVSVSTSAFAQNSPVTQMEPVIVVGGISPVAADEFGRSFSVVTRQEIEERGLQTVQQALESLPGISINGTGPNDRDIRIRGGESNHVLVLLDGKRLSAGDSGYSLRGLDVNNVEKIEVIRGPQSVPFGTDAASGVVNIVTRQARAGVSIGGQVEIGEGDRESFYVTHGTDVSDFSLSLSNTYDEGFDFSGDGGEKDSTSWESVSSKASTKLTKDLKLGYSLRVADSGYDFDDETFLSGDTETTRDNYVFDDVTKFEKLLERSWSTFVEHQSFDDTVTHRLQADVTSNQTSNSGISDQETKIFRYRGQFALDAAPSDSSDQLASLLLETKTDSAGSSDQERDNDSIAVDYRGQVAKGLTVQSGARLDTSDSFADAVTWNVASSYYLQPDVRIKASVGRAVVYPSFFDIYGAEFEAFSSGSKDSVYRPTDSVDPEENFGFDIGGELSFLEGNAVVALTYFNETLKNEIHTREIEEDETSDTEFYIADNRDEDSDRQGVELFGELSLSEQFEVGASYTYIDSTSRGEDVEGRRPKHEFGLNTAWHSSTLPLTITGDWRYVSDLYDQQFYKADDPFAKLPSFSVVDLAAEYRLTANIDVTARVTNALDKEYQEVWGYATRGRAGFIGVRASF
jgi:vitamin B12 transporter